MLVLELGDGAGVHVLHILGEIVAAIYVIYLGLGKMGCCFDVLREFGPQAGLILLALFYEGAHHLVIGVFVWICHFKSQNIFYLLNKMDH